MKNIKLKRRNNGVYYVDYIDVTGKRVRKSLATKNAREAKEKYNQIKFSDDGHITPIKFGELVDEFLKNSYFKDWTKKMMKYQLDRFLIDLNLFNQYVHTFTIRQFNRYIELLKANNLKPTTINKYIINVKKIFKYAYKNGYIKKNILRDVELLKEPKFEKIVFSDDDLKKIFEYIKGKKYEAMFYILYYTGLRINEAAKLRVCDIDFDKNIIKVGANEFGTIKTKRDSYIVLFDQLREYLINYIERRELKKNDFIVLKTEPVRTKTFYQYFLKLRKRLNLNKGYSPYTFRHTFATKLLLSGTDIYVVSRLLRHSSIKTTEKIYIHADYKTLFNNIDTSVLTL